MSGECRRLSPDAFRKKLEQKDDGGGLMTSVVKYRNREIDLRPYFEGFPYIGFMCVDVLDQLYYFHRGEKVTLRRTGLQPHPDLDAGELVSDLDFNLFSAGNFQFDPDNGYAYFVGDEKNDEQFNIYRLDLATGEREKLTDEEYIYGMKLLQGKSGDRLHCQKKDSQPDGIVSESHGYRLRRDIDPCPG